MGKKGKNELHLVGNGGFLLCPTPNEVFTRERLDAEQLEIGKQVQNFIDNKVLPRIHEIEEKKCEPDGVPLSVKLNREAGELGFLAVDLPEEYGGLEMDLTTTMHVAEMIGRSGGSFTTTSIAHMGIGTLPILFFGTPEQRAKYLPKIANAEWLSCYALTETDSGSDALSGKSKAVLEGDFYILNGAKQFISNGSWADVAIVFCRIEDQYSALIVELNQPGVIRGAEEKKLGLHGSSTTNLTFENVKVPKENLLGKVGDAATIALNILNMGRMELGFGTLGAAKRILQLTLDYTRQRKQFGRPVIEFDMQLAKFADLVAWCFAVDSIVYRIANAVDQKIATIDKGPEYWDNVVKMIRSYAMEASIAKVEGSEMCYSVALGSLEMHGGYGYVEEYHVERALRDSVINMIYEGTNDINRLVIFDFLVRNIYGGGIPFLGFMDEVEEGLRKRSFDYPDKTNLVLLAEKSRLYAAKHLVCFLVNETVMRFGKEIKTNQQVMQNLSDMLIQLYRTDSVIARATYLSESKSKNRETAQKIARLVTGQSLVAIGNLAWQTLSEIYDGKECSSVYDKVGWLVSLTQSKDNLMRLKREIGNVVLEKGLKFVNL